MIVIDAHEDLAWNVLTFGRDYLRPVAETRALEQGSEAVEHNGETLLGWDAWMAGRVAVVFATLYVSPAWSPLAASNERSYATADAAHRLYREQLELYQRLAREHPDRFVLVRTGADLERVLAGWEGGDPAARRVGLVLLMEGADGIREPEEVAWWVAEGVRLIGPAWSATRYCGGTGRPGPFTAEGRALLRAMAAQNVILDLSHLSDEGVDEALAEYGGPLVATHSNARALAPVTQAPERHLTDAAIRGIAARDGVIGVVLLNNFLKAGVTRESPKAAVTLADVAAQIDYLCQQIGDAAHVGIGSDFDGGFGRSRAPLELDSAADLPRIGEALAARGYRDAQIEAILGGNWLRLLRRTLPAG